MTKRKITGIIPYGKRLNYGIKVIKLESGGFVSMSRGYNWTEDPYELMLMQKKAPSKGGSGRRRAAPKPRKPPKPVKPEKIDIDKFPVIEEGLESSRVEAQKRYNAELSKYYDIVEQNPAILNEVAGAKMLQHLVNFRQREVESLKREEERFDKLTENITDEELDMPALSSDGRIFASKITGSEEKGFKKEMPKIIDKTEYLENIGSYEPAKMKDLIYWKNNIDTSGTIDEVEAFISGNVVGDKKFRELYVKGKQNSIQMRLEKGKLRTDLAINGVVGGVDLGNTDQFLASFENIRGRVNSDVEILQGTNLNAWSVAEDMYKSLFGKSANSHAKMSLESAYLKDPKNIAFLAGIPVKQRRWYLDQGITIDLVSKIVDENFKSDVDEKTPIPTNPVTSGYSTILQDPIKFQFKYGNYYGVPSELEKEDGYRNDKKREISSARSYPAIPNHIKTETITVNDKNNNKSLNLTDNKMVNNKAYYKNLILDKPFSMYGENLLHELDVSYDDFYNKSIIAAPNKNIDLIMIPTNSDTSQPLVGKDTWHKDEKIAMRQHYIDSYTEVYKKAPATDAEGLVDRRAGVAGTDYQGYINWISSVSKSKEIDEMYDKVQKFTTEELKDPKIAKIKKDAEIARDMKNLAVAAFKIRRKEVNKFRKKHNVIITPWALVTGSYEDSGINSKYHKTLEKGAKKHGGMSGSTEDIDDNGVSIGILEHDDMQMDYANLFGETVNHIQFYVRYRRAAAILAGREGITSVQSEEANSSENDFLNRMAEITPLTTTDDKILIQLYK